MAKSIVKASIVSLVATLALEAQVAKTGYENFDNQQVWEYQEGYDSKEKAVVKSQSNKQQATSNKQQATSNKQQATSNKQQATSNKQQATSNKQQATSNKQQANDNSNILKEPLYEENLNEQGLQKRTYQDEHFKINYKFHIDNEGITFEDLGIDEEWLKESIVQYNIQDFSKASLQNIANITAFYMQYSGYPSATAYVPSQEVDESNTITINIAIGRFGKFILANQSYQVKDSAILSKLSDSLKGEILTIYNVEDNIYKVNELAGIESIAMLQAGENYGETDIVVSAADTLKAKAVLFTDNYGIESSGAYRLGASFNFNNVFGYGDSFDSFIQVTDEFQKNYGVNYNFFINNFKFTPRVSKSNYSLGGIYEELGATGESTNLGLDIKYPIFLNSRYGFSLKAGYDKKWLRDSYETYGIHYKKHANVGYAGYEAYYNTPTNRLNADFKIYYGDIKPKSFFSRYSATNGNFAKVTFSLNNNHFLSDTFTLVTNLNLQQSLNDKKRLDSSESSYLGGAYGVRAYRSGEGDADNTIYAMLGVRVKTPINNLYATPFYEAGYAWNQNNLFEETFLDSAGLELLYLKPNNYYIKADLARAVNKYKYDGKARARIYLGAGIYF